MTPAREANAGTARKLRKGRDRCTAHRRDGKPCGAPAIEGGLVCLKHGGAARQVQLAARRLVLMERNYRAWHELETMERGSARWREALYRACGAQHELEQYEADLDLIALLRMELTDPSSPAVRRDLLEAARARLDGRPWNSPLRR